MARMRRSIRSLWGIALVVSLLAPALPAAQAGGQDASGPGASSPLRRSVTPAELQSDYERTTDWLAGWMRTRSPRPPVDPTQQSQTVAEWTVLVHIAADNNLELAGLSDLNEMEAVGSSPQVNIVAQIDRSADYVTLDGDWTETRRYYVQQDDDPEAITSPVVFSPGELDSGSAATIADFATWGIQTYPAKKYMLVLWDHGGGWTSHSSDEDSGSEVTLPDTVAALERIVAETGIGQFEVVGFDMCLMGQLEVFQAVAPFARFGIGSQENEPGAGWFYTFLDELVRNPAMDGGQLGQHVVDYFMYFLREVVGDQDVYGLAAVDLGQSAPLVNALNDFVNTIAANPQRALSAIADARNNTIQYGGFDDPQVQGYWSSVDLYRFMELLADLAPAPEIAQSASGVMQAVRQFVIYEDHATALDGSNGVSIYFPTTRKAYKLGANN